MLDGNAIHVPNNRNTTYNILHGNNERTITKKMETTKYDQIIKNSKTTTKEKQEEELQSRATKRNMIFKNVNKLLGNQRAITNFKQPILFLMRNNKKIEFHENATKGTFTYQHTNGEKRTIHLTGQGLYDFQYGGKTFAGYICHEDIATPLPENPIVSTEIMGQAIEATTAVNKKWDLKKAESTKELMKGIAIVLAVIIGGGILLYILAPQLFEGTITQTVQNVTQNVTQNISQIPPPKQIM